MVGFVPGGVFDHPHANIPGLDRSPKRASALSRMFGLGYVRPINGGEWDPFELHTPRRLAHSAAECGESLLQIVLVHRRREEDVCAQFTEERFGDLGQLSRI